MAGGFGGMGYADIQNGALVQNQTATGKIYFGLGGDRPMRGSQAAGADGPGELRRDGLLEPERRDRAGRHRPRDPDRPDGPLALRVQGPGRHRRRYPRRRGDRRVEGPQGLLRRAEGPRDPDRGRRAPVPGPAASPGGSRAGRGHRSRRMPARTRGRSARRSRSTADGVDEVLFDPFEVPAGDSVRLDISARTGGDGGSADAMTSRCRSAPGACRRMPPPRAAPRTTRRPSSPCPTGREYDDPEMLIVLSPTRCAAC